MACSFLSAQAEHLTDPPEYQGYRIYLTKVEIKKVKPSFAEIAYTVVNTGREPFKLIPELREKMVVKSDVSLKAMLAQIEENDFMTAFFNSGITLAPGQMHQVAGLKVVHIAPVSNPAPAENIIAEQEHPAIPASTNDVEDLVQDHTEKTNDAIVEIESPTTEKENDEDEIEKVVIEEKQPIEEKIDSANDDLAIAETQAADEAEIISEAKELTSEEAVEEEGCSDLILEKLSIHKRTKNHVHLGYTLRNIGVGKINLKGQKGAEALALRGHLSSSAQLSRGALTIGGQFVDADEENAWIAPGKTFNGIVKLPLHKLTKFTPYLILQVDPYQIVTECDETNNLQHINLLPDSPLSQSQSQ